MLINDILDLSKIEARKLELVSDSVDLPSFLHGVTEICRIRAEQKGINFNVAISDRLPLTIETDEKRLRQVLINLLGNAIKFTDKGGVFFKVEVLDEQDSEQAPIAQIRFQIEDTGVGMSADQLEKIFLPFEQVGSVEQRSEGTGLGLAISHTIATLMGSQIQVQSRLGEGSIFWLDLTVPVTLAQINSTQQNIPRVPGSVSEVTVNDNNHRILNRSQQEIGCQTPEANDGKQGLELVTESKSQPPSPKPEATGDSEWVIPSQDVLQQLYHLAMMGDIEGIEEILNQQVEENKQLVPFASELNKLAKSFQTAKIRKKIKSLVL